MCDVVSRWLVMCGLLGSPCLLTGCAMLPAARPAAVQTTALPATATESHFAVLATSAEAAGVCAHEPIQAVAYVSEARPAEPDPDGQPLDLATALQLSGGESIQVAFARERIKEAFADWSRARVLWLPSLRLGTAYNKHEGEIQDVAGHVFDTSRNAFYSGAGASALGAGSPALSGVYAQVPLTDAFFQPRIAEAVTAARQSAANGTVNDNLYQTAAAYLELLRAYQEVAIARETVENTQGLVDLTQAYAKSGQGLELDYNRAQAELALRKNDRLRAEEAVQVASARLAELLRSDPTTGFRPQEPAVVPLHLHPPEAAVRDQVAQGLASRPEAAESRSLVAEAVQRLQRERYAPLIPSVLLGVSYGEFAGGLGGRFENSGARLDADVAAFWELRNLGAGEQAARWQACSRVHQAELRQVGVLDRIAREVVESHAQVQSRHRQLPIAEEGIQLALESYQHNRERIQDARGLPIEVLQSIQAVTQARREYLRVVTDYNLAQFALHRALGWPGEVTGTPN